MSNTDKTREKLVSSMRKTKAGSEDKETATSGAAQTGQPKTDATAGAPGAAKSPKETAQKPRPKAGKTTSKEGTSDPYQSGGRVWPD